MNAKRRLLELGLLLGVLPGCREPATEEPLRPVRAMKVGDTASFAAGSFPGRAKATQEVELSFRVSGPLITRPVSVGDELKKRDILAAIDPRDFKLSVQNVEGQLEQAKARLEFAESDFKRAENMRAEDPGAISGTLFDQKRKDRDGARAQVKSLTASLDAAKAALADTELTAPFDGTIVATYVENFEYVRAKQPIVRLLDTSKIEMVINLPERAMPAVKYVDELWCRFDQFKDLDLKIPARIKEIGTEASKTTRTYPITLIMEQPPGVKILPGMAAVVSGTVRLPEEWAQQGIEVPLGAVFTPDTERTDYVWVIDEQTETVKRRRVTKGKLTHAGIMVTDGLKPGEWIATAGVHSLREGQKIRILK